MIDNKWYALVAVLFGNSSAFNAYRYVKDKQQKRGWAKSLKNRRKHYKILK